MSNLNLSNLQNNRNEILKAEIGALLFNLGKTHAGISNWKDYFPGVTSSFRNYKKYYEENQFEDELIETDSKLKEFIFDKKVKLPDNSELKWFDFFRGDASSEDFIKKIFFRGCENINSGIDKGSPNKQNKQLEKLWISNAFGSFKRDVEEKYFDETRQCFFNRFHRYLEDNNYYSDPDWRKIRNWIFDEVKSWYSRLLSDSRFPVNDVTLFDQAYMTASMFKAVLAGLFLEPSKYSEYLENPQSIKWSILGIQYDKLGLAEKGLKVASIKWYRDTSDKVDNEIKKLIEIEYALGNEVYRDETGIYFVVGENIIGNKDESFYKLNGDLDKIKEKIQDIFSNNFEDEIYPAIFLTEASRGLMNLGHLVEKAKENFLKAEYKRLPNVTLEEIEFPEEEEKKEKHYVHPEKNFVNEDDENNKKPNTSIGICPICKIRLVFRSDLDKRNDPPICETCHKRFHHAQVRDWLRKAEGETIWLDELQDKNGRVALVTLKFELGKWLNGDLVNSLLVRDEDFKNYFSDLEKIFNRITKIIKFDLLRNLNNNSEITNFIKLFDKNGIQKPFESVLKDKTIRKILTQQLNNLKEREKELKNLFFRCLDYTLIVFEKSINDWISFIDNSFSVSSNFDITDKRFKNQSVFQNSSLTSFIKDSFTFGFIVMQIYNTLLERSIGSKWEEFIYKELRDWDNSNNKPLKQKINFDDRKIYWEKLNNDDIKFLSQILLQFLLRKNPSPARLRRIWETTRDFFEALEENILILAGIKENRQKRLIWNNVDIADGEYKDGEILFWAKDKTVYLISSIEKISDKEIFNLKPYNEKNSNNVSILKKSDAVIKSYQPYFTILKPTPISWQFIIPAENLPQLIENVQKEYYKNFKWVYGKLPLHMGIIVQNYKKPLYVGIKALRKIRRDGVEWDKLGKEISAEDFRVRQEKFNRRENPENTELCENFYSLFEKIENEGKYEFYLYPEKRKKIWLDTTQDVTEKGKFKFKIYPNTVDFEFLDTNTRRNDIYYNGETGKRYLKTRQMRPYDLNDWQYFERFKEFLLQDKKSSSKLQKLISLIYSKTEDWNDSESLKQFMISAFVNVLELKEDKNQFADILGVDIKRMDAKEFNEKLLMLIDMFDFWHTMLKYQGGR